MNKVTREEFEAYVAVQESGFYNMFDPRALALANEMNDLNIGRGKWVFIMTNYATLKEQYYATH